jgi:hypothetical protein
VLSAVAVQGIVEQPEIPRHTKHDDSVGSSGCIACSPDRCSLTRTDSLGEKPSRAISLAWLNDVQQWYSTTLTSQRRRPPLFPSNRCPLLFLHLLDSWFPLYLPSSHGSTRFRTGFESQECRGSARRLDIASPHPRGSCGTTSCGVGRTRQ